MKKLHTFLLLTVSGLFFTGCDTNDNTFYNDVFVSSPDLVTIEASLAGYHVGDKIYLHANIDRLLDVDNHTNLLDIRKSSGYADRFNFSYVLEKRTTGNDWEVVNIDPSAIDVTDGSILSGSFYYAGAIYSAATDSYNFRAGIPLLSAGDYRLSFGYNSSETQVIEIRSESVNNNLFVNLISDESNNLINSNGYYPFTVL